MLISTPDLLEAIHEGFLMVNTAWQVTHTNRRAQIMLRLADPQPPTLNLWDLLPDNPTTPTRRELERAREQQVTVEFDVFYPALYVWHEVRAVPTGDGLALLLRDITDRQWLLRREAERAYMRNLFDDAPVAISITRGRDHQFEFVNRFARQLSGGRIVEGRTYRELFPELADQGFTALLDQVYQSGTPYHAAEQLVRLDRQGTGMVEDSYFTFTYQPLRGFDNQVSGILTLAVEVTTQVVARHEQAHQAAVQATIVRDLPVGVIVTDAAGSIRMANTAADVIHGATVLAMAAEEYAAMYQGLTPTGDPYPPGQLPLTRALRTRVGGDHAQWAIRRPDGTVITVEGRAQPILLDDDLVGAVLTLWPRPGEDARLPAS